MMSIDDMWICVCCACFRAPNSSLSFPKSLEELRQLSATLQVLKDEHFYAVLGLFAAAYLYKQSFAIPGSVFLVNASSHATGNYHGNYM